MALLHRTFIHPMAIHNNNVALLVHSCDRYELLYEGFAYFFAKHWDFKIDCSYYFATEEKRASVRHFTHIRSGKGAWADRLALLLREQIPERYVLYFQEDMWLDSPVSAGFFNELFALAQKNGWQQVKLHSSDVYKTIPTGTFIEGFNVSKLDNSRSDFLMSHQVTLWDKEVLLAQLHKKEHPWRNERKGTKRMRKIDPEIYQLDYFAENGQAPINPNDGAVVRSGYHTISVNGLLNHTVEPYLEALRQAGPEYAAYAAKLTHNYEHQLTHDGKPKPRKEDIFKKAKNWLRG